MRKNRNKRKIKNIGEIQFDFDYKYEKYIYCYLCCRRIKKVNLRKICEKDKVESYCEWKKRIESKYTKYERNQLEEFSRFLNLCIRNLKPDREYINICYPVFFTLILSKIVEGLMNLNLTSLINQNFIFFLIASLIVICIFYMPFLFVIYKMFSQLFDNNDEKNMLIDYKEIIDGIIKQD